MKEAIITDFNPIEMDFAKQDRLKNRQVRFDFSNCYYIIEEDPHSPFGLRINKVGKNRTNTDQISVQPHASNSISIF